MHRGMKRLYGSRLFNSLIVAMSLVLVVMFYLSGYGEFYYIFSILGIYWSLFWWYWHSRI